MKVLTHLSLSFLVAVFKSWALAPLLFNTSSCHCNCLEKVRAVGGEAGNATPGI